jgi:hypothetical protein
MYYKRKSFEKTSSPSISPIQGHDDDAFYLLFLQEQIDFLFFFGSFSL